jgi:hypothetical protein
MSLDQAIEDITGIIKGVSKDVVIRVLRQSEEEASIRAYAPASDEKAIKDSTRERTFELFTKEGLDVQVIFYDVADNLPPKE